MGKKKKVSKGNVAIGNPIFHSLTLCEEKLGKKEVNVSSMLKMEHLQNLATWASGEGSVPCLAALFGRSLAANAEAAGVPLDRSLFACLKCETILQPGDNCTARIEKYMKKARRCSKKPRVPLQNNVVYTCHFCSYRNVMVGTIKGRVNELLMSRAEASKAVCLDSIESKSCPWKDVETNQNFNDREGNLDSSIVQQTVLETPDYIPVTPSQKTVFKRLGVLSEKKQKINQSGSSKPSVDAGKGAWSSTVTVAQAGKGTSGSTKRRKRGWTSLKEIVERNERTSKSSISNFVIPFKL